MFEELTKCVVLLDRAQLLNNQLDVHNLIGDALDILTVLCKEIEISQTGGGETGQLPGAKAPVFKKG